MDNKIEWERPQTSYTGTPLSEETSKIEHALSQAQLIKWLGVISIVVAIILFIMFFVLFFVNWIVSIVAFSIFIVFNLIVSLVVIVKIAKTDWVDIRLNKSKKSYWISSLALTIICIPIIASGNWISWAGTVKRVLENRLAIMK